MAATPRIGLRDLIAPALLPGTIEIVPSPDLSRARRNLLFATSLLFILSVANPATVSLPGFGDTELNGGLAMLLIATATLLFWYEYDLEYRLTRLRNNMLFAGADASSVDRALERFKAETSNHVENVERLGRDLRQHLANMFPANPEAQSSLLEEFKLSSDRFKSLLRLDDAEHPRGDQRRPDITEELERLALIAQRIEQRSNALEQRDGRAWSNASRKMDQVSGAIHANSHNAESLLVGLEAISLSIHRFQGVAFFWKDLFAITVFLWVTLGVTTYRLVERLEAGLPRAEVGGWVFGILFGLLGVRIVLKRSAETIRRSIALPISLGG